MTDTNETRTLLDRAHGMLAQATRWGNLTEDETLQVMAAGASTGKQQQAALTFAGALALVAAAESLESIAGALAIISDHLESVAVWVNQTGPGR